MAVVQLRDRYYEGLSTDTKPTGVLLRTVFKETDTQAMYISNDGGVTWDNAGGVAGLHKHLAASGSVKATKGVLRSVVINRPSTSDGATITLYDSEDNSGKVIAIIAMTMSKESYVMPTTLDYNIVLNKGLYAEFSHEDGADITVSYN